ncbi:flagellin [Demequina sp. TTPB684]|uniref:flagellin N-terminal helical domain-containing protein n=1 Tax=unclassified Demequina TaxID=2620311 RepID=UPI001CF13222|nr:MULTISPECIES: flagellin [unclassified Demequina]MCB2411965.1 flagellin [Demequina sp. TTPB684]UPU87903.1 flagellin [Demequina sp. TMPB413]
MGLSINQNIAAVNSYRNLSNTQNDLSKSLEKLSSGFRINRAADDAAGLAISEGLRSQIGGLKQAVRNSQDGISVVQTAEGALTETHAILQRMRDLGVQAANDGGLSSDAKGNIQSEMSQLKDELTRIADTTQFNGTKLLDGNYTGKFQVGANVGETISVGIGTSMGAAGLGVGGVDVTTAGGAGAAASVWTSSADFSGATIAASTTVDVVVNGKTVTLDGGAAGIDETGIATQITAAGVGVTATMNGTALELTATNDGPSAISVSGFSAIVAGTDEGTLVAGSNGATSGAENAITAIDAAIKTVSTTRADLGAVQNRFDHTVKNLNVAVENLSASESRIRDTDMASEMVNFTRAQILSQAGTAMLAQANQIPQGVLSLLR